MRSPLGCRACQGAGPLRGLAAARSSHRSRRLWTNSLRSGLSLFREKDKDKEKGEKKEKKSKKDKKADEAEAEEKEEKSSGESAAVR